MAGGIILAIFAIVLGTYASFTARCKGPILSNPWIWMTKEERQKELAKVDIKAEYRQLTIICGGFAIALAYFSVSSFLSWRLPHYPMWIIIALVLLYAIGSSIISVIRDGKKQ